MLIKKIFRQDIVQGVLKPMWMGKAYHDVLRDRGVYIIYPFHYLVRLTWWLNLKWAEHTGKPSWIDKQVAVLWGIHRSNEVATKYIVEQAQLKAAWISGGCSMKNKILRGLKSEEDTPQLRAIIASIKAL